MRRLILAAAVAVACAGDRPQGLMATPPGTGPSVVWDLDAKPLPEIPLPNDTATRIDEGSPTFRRLNVSLDAPTAYERETRAHANRLEGFGTYAPLSVRFTGPLDLDNIVRRQRDNKDFADDVVLLVNLQPGSRNFGKLWPLDFGHGNFPLTVADPNRYWPSDPRREVENLLFDTTDEDKDRDGSLDPTEDTDDDGWLDVANVHPPGADPVDGLLAFYEKTTNTLVFRPVLPLDHESTYAAVLTRRLTGVNGEPVRSPFPYVHHTRQTDALRELPRALALNGFTMQDVAFAWTFTTQGPTRDLEALRRGLYGVGPFARLAKEFPPDAEIRPAVSEGERPHLLAAAKIVELARIVLPFVVGGDDAGIERVVESMSNIAYVVHGEVEGPNLLADKDGIASPGYPADDDEIWDLNRKTGEAYYRPQRIRFWCSIPRKDRGRGPPFPVAFYMHGHTSSRFDMVGFAGFMARYGIAHCGISAYGHGLVVPPELQGVADALIDGLKVRPIVGAIIPDRARDLDNDGVPDSGVDFWVAELFHLRDMVRQSVLDLMVVMRALRGFDGVRTGPDLDGDGRPDLAGDFDGDGIVDLGGPAQDYFVWGHSLGGILSSIVAGIEPAIVAAAPVCYAAGLTDVGLRTARFGVPNSVLLPVMGPIFYGEPGPAPGQVTVKAVVRTGNDEVRVELFSTDVVRAGDRVRIVNLANGEAYTTFADSGRRFRLHVAADALDATTKRALLKIQAPPADPVIPPDTRFLGDPLRIDVYDGASGPLRQSFDRFGRDVVFQGVKYPAGAPLVSLMKGLGLQRNTPRFRRLLGLFSQAFVDPGDPVNYTPHYFQDPLPSLDYDPAEPGANVLLMPTVGDPGVSVAAGIAGARAAGLIDLYTADPRYGKTVNEVLIDNYIVEGLARLRRFGGREILMDPENFSQGRWVPDAPRLDPPLRLTRATGKGLQALRLPFLDPRGQHCFGIPEPDRAFDNNTFLIHLIARYFQTRGREIRDDDVCMEKQACAWMPPNAPAP